MRNVWRFIAFIGALPWLLWRWRGRIVLLCIAAVLCFAAYLYVDYWYRDKPQAFFDDGARQFKYGSTGGERLAGIPVGIFKALPTLCRDYLPKKADGTPGEGWQSLGFLYEPGMDRPVGTSLRHSLGFDRISLNCAACHAGTWRDGPQGTAHIVPGMPAQRLDLVGFAKFVAACAMDERFNPWQVIQAAEQTGEHYTWFQRLLLRYTAVPAMREGLILVNYRFRFIDHETAAGPGRFDTFGPEKALLNWPLERLPPRQTVGIVDFPSLWLQAPRQGMHLHWDGNNNSLEERNRSASFGTGAVPTTADRPSLSVIAAWLRSPANQPPAYPFPIDQAKADRGRVRYDEYCAGCHGRNGRDFTGRWIGQPDPIEHVRTDPCRLDNYTPELAAEQGNLYAAYPAERFSHFRKTHGYANMPLDGIWLRGPYLHNGSVPAVRDLLEPSANRPAVFYRGGDIVDQARLGFIANQPVQGDRALFRFETKCVSGAACANEINPENRHDDNICVAGKWAGNSNRGHEGPDYGTDLPAEDKDAIVEYLKTF
ncbi:MAG: hypothetical protein U1E70_05975 [Acetobacteraceae bacterium]